jgi:hypothetical protein
LPQLPHEFAAASGTIAPDQKESRVVGANQMNQLPLLEVFKTLVQFVLGPMICVWFTAELKRRSKPKKRQDRKRIRKHHDV